MDNNFCQSCAMPMDNSEVYGTNADGSKNEENCIYCYEKGRYTTDITMEEMIEVCVPHMVEHGGMTESAARNMMNETFPKLKRWSVK